MKLQGSYRSSGVYMYMDSEADEDERTSFTFRQGVENFIISLILAFIGCACFSLPWYLFSLHGSLKVIVNIFLVIVVWAFSSAVIRMLVNPKL